MKENDLLCPSAAFTPESFLFGILNSSGTINYTDDPIALTDDILDTISSIPFPEKHFRFTTRCHHGNCEQWNDGKCSVAASFHHANEVLKHENAIPCCLEKACRWFNQEGVFACSVCKYIVTDLS